MRKDAVIWTCIGGYLLIAVIVMVVGMRHEAIEKGKEGIKYKSEGGWPVLGLIWAPAAIFFIVGSVVFCVFWVIEHGWEHFHNFITKGVEVKPKPMEEMEDDDDWDP